MQRHCKGITVLLQRHYSVAANGMQHYCKVIAELLQTNCSVFAMGITLIIEGIPVCF